jgi:hypothetical protein
MKAPGFNPRNVDYEVKTRPDSKFAFQNATCTAYWKEQRARLAEERRMSNIKQAQQASVMREQLTVNTLKMQRDLFVDTHKRVNEMAKTLASQASLPKI